VGLSVGAITLMVAGRRLGLGLAPVPLVVVAAVIWSGLSDFGGSTVGNLETGVPISPVDLPWGELGGLLLPALIIAVVGFVEPTTIGRTLLERDRRWNADRELVSQGVANLASGFAGGFPVSGSFSRSALNLAAGARTRLSGAASGLLVLAFIPFADVLGDLPSAIPAAIVVVAVAGLARPRRLVRLARSSRTQFGVAMATFVLVLVLAPRIDEAVAIGIALAVAVHLWREMRVPVAVHVEEGTLHLHPAGVLWFGSAARFEDEVGGIAAAHPDCARLVIHLDGLGRVDLTGARSLARVLEDARRRGLGASVEGIPPTTGGMIGRVLGGGESPEERR
jgi:SulP family sulfate permease